MYNSALRTALHPNATGSNLPVADGTQVTCYRGDLHLQGDYYPAGDYQPGNQIHIRAEQNIILGSSHGAGQLEQNGGGK